MSMTKGTPLSSQIIWLEERVKELEATCLEQKNELISIKRGQYFKENEKLKEEIMKLEDKNHSHELLHENFWRVREHRLLNDISGLKEEIADLKKQIHCEPKKDTRWHPWNVSIVDVPPHGNVIVMFDNGETHSTHSDLVSWQKVCHHNDIVAWKWA